MIAASIVPSAIAAAVVILVTVPAPTTGCAALNIGTPSPWFVAKPLLYKSAAFCCFVLPIALANPFALSFAKVSYKLSSIASSVTANANATVSLVYLEV